MKKILLLFSMLAALLLLYGAMVFTALDAAAQTTQVFPNTNWSFAQKVSWCPASFTVPQRIPRYTLDIRSDRVGFDSSAVFSSRGWLGIGMEPVKPFSVNTNGDSLWLQVAGDGNWPVISSNKFFRSGLSVNTSLFAGAGQGIPFFWNDTLDTEPQRLFFSPVTGDFFAGNVTATTGLDLQPSNDYVKLSSADRLDLQAVDIRMPDLPGSGECLWQDTVTKRIYRVPCTGGSGSPVNGLQSIGGNTGMGGTLTQATDIDCDGSTFTITDSTTQLMMGLYEISPGVFLPVHGIITEDSPGQLTLIGRSNMGTGPSLLFQFIDLASGRQNGMYVLSDRNGLVQWDALFKYQFGFTSYQQNADHFAFAPDLEGPVPGQGLDVALVKTTLENLRHQFYHDTTGGFANMHYNEIIQTDKIIMRAGHADIVDDTAFVAFQDGSIRLPQYINGSLQVDATGNLSVGPAAFLDADNLFTHTIAPGQENGFSDTFFENVQSALIYLGTGVLPQSGFSINPVTGFLSFNTPLTAGDELQILRLY